MHIYPFNNNDFLVYLILLTIAPALLTAAIYLTLSRIVIAYGAELSRFKPRTYTLVFCTFDLLSLVLQGLGGGIAATAGSISGKNSGKDIMLVGLIWQIISLIIFALACGEFAIRVRKSRDSWNPKLLDLVNSALFKAFLYGTRSPHIFVFS